MSEGVIVGTTVGVRVAARQTTNPRTKQPEKALGAGNTFQTNIQIIEYSQVCK